MCRLYGFRSNEGTKVECTLVRAQNALLAQSRSDRRGVPHPDGWGIGYYEDGLPRIERKSSAAFADSSFSVTAERMFARTVLAHVRRATVGGAAPENCHPFAFGRWAFAHNGTVTAFERLRPRLEAETEDDLLKARRGITDSETAFLWLLARCRRHGIALDRRADAGQLAAILRESVVALDRLCAAEGVDQPAKLNFILTDGAAMVASRLGNSLYWVARRGVHDCEICGIPHVHHDRDRLYKAVVLASEPISHEDWREVPEACVLAVDEAVEAALHSA